MTTTKINKKQKRELIRLSKEHTDYDEYRKAVRAFYKKEGIELPTLKDKWEKESRLYKQRR